MNAIYSDKSIDSLITEYKKNPDKLPWADILKLPAQYQKEAFIRLCKGSGAFLRTVINGGYVSESILSMDLPESVKTKIVSYMLDSNKVSYQQAACTYISKHQESSYGDSTLNRYFEIEASNGVMTSDDAQNLLARAKQLTNNQSTIKELEANIKYKDKSIDKNGLSTIG
jgi:hypothetical protein